jgi:hypothetical protein
MIFRLGGGRRRCAEGQHGAHLTLPKRSPYPPQRHIFSGAIMDTTERQVIDELFGKIEQAEAASGPRDPAAEAHIQARMRQQPAAPYYMAQAIVIQEQALVAANARIEELQRQLEARPAAGGFLSSLFGGGAPATATRAVPPQAMAGYDPRVAQYADPRFRQGQGGFLGGAMQTAMGVAGGLLLGSALASMFAPDAAAAEPPAEEPAFDGDGGFGDEEF